ncbi:MAG TPA: response regulator [Candidatus Limnocylindria bacterium]|nr:response regulator [Candidatus Limnocylindria bacterium]
MGRVVFVEDDPAIRKLVGVALRSTPHEVHIATNGREGLALALRVRPDAVFTDVSMPEMDGLALADAIRARPELANTRIVFITASVQKEQVERYLARGASAYLAKPFSPKDLRAQVDKWTGAGA